MICDECVISRLAVAPLEIVLSHRSLAPSLFFFFFSHLGPGRAHYHNHNLWTVSDGEGHAVVVVVAVVGCVDQLVLSRRAWGGPRGVVDHLSSTPYCEIFNPSQYRKHLNLCLLTRSLQLVRNSLYGPHQHEPGGCSSQLKGTVVAI